MKTKKPFAEIIKKRYTQQGKKDKDELQNVALSGATKNKQRKKLNAGDMSVGSDTHPVDNFRKCIICGKQFEISEKRRNHYQVSKVIRGKNCKTCSKKCAFEYQYKRRLKWTK